MHVIVHIGQPKAGSTSIQMTLQGERGHLANHGVVVGPGSKPLSLALSRNDKIAESPKLRHKHGTMDAARADSERHWDGLRATLADTRPPVTLLSSEHLMAVSEAMVARLRPMFDRISVLCYVRDPVSFYASSLDQSIRGGDRFRELPLPNRGRQPIADRIRAWQAAVGAENVHVRNFDRANLVGGDVVADYFAQVSRISGQEIAPANPPRISNESFCGAATVWLMTVNETYDRRSPAADRATLALRQGLINRMRAAEALKALPRLKLTDPVLVAAVRRSRQADLDWLNENVLQGQLPLETALPEGAPAEDPDPATLRARLRDWLLGYLTPEAIPLITREILAGPAPAAAKTPPKPAAGKAHKAAGPDAAARRAARRTAAAGQGG